MTKYHKMFTNIYFTSSECLKDVYNHGNKNCELEAWDILIYPCIENGFLADFLVVEEGFRSHL